MSTETNSLSARNGMQLLLDLPQELFDLLLCEVPLESHIALSITCHAARQVFLGLHGHDKTWASRRTMCDDPETFTPYLRFLDDLERDLADRYFCCHQCEQLHPFYDLATETSPAEINRRLAQTKHGGYCPVMEADREPWEAFLEQPEDGDSDSSCCPVIESDHEPWEAFAARASHGEAAAGEQRRNFSISIRQLRLVEHHMQFGHGIPMSYLCGGNIATSSSSALPSISTGSSPSSSAAAAIATPSSPRWRRRFDYGIHGEHHLYIVEYHELVYDGDDGRAVRRYLDQTPHHICPHLVMHDITEARPLDLHRLLHRSNRDWAGPAGAGAARGGLACREVWDERRDSGYPVLRFEDIGIEMGHLHGEHPKPLWDPLFGSGCESMESCNPCQTVWLWKTGGHRLRKLNKERFEHPDGGDGVHGRGRVWLSLTNYTLLNRYKRDYQPS